MDYHCYETPVVQHRLSRDLCHRDRLNTPLCRQASARPETAKRNKQPYKPQTLKVHQAFQQGLRIYEQLGIAQEVAFAQALLASVVDE